MKPAVRYQGSPRKLSGELQTKSSRSNPTSPVAENCTLGFAIRSKPRGV